jgi:ferredoxin
LFCPHTLKFKCKWSSLSPADSSRVLTEMKAMIWKVTDACTACGTCADVCPVDPTLYVVEDKAVYQVARADECTECYACVDSCPEGAIEEA